MIKRKLDSLMRITIPKVFIKELEFLPEQKIEISMEYGVICIRKFKPENYKTRPYIGDIKKLDMINRITLPRGYANLLGLKKGDEVEIDIVRGVIKIL